MREIYEDEKTLEHEKMIMEAVLPRLAKYDIVGFYKLNALSYGLDYALLDRHDKVIGWAEVKRRHNPMKQYKTLFIAAQKIMKVRIFSALYPLPVKYFAGFDDAIGMLDLTIPPSFIAIGGRTDRNDPDDIEPMCHYPIDPHVYRLLNWEGPE